MNEHRWLAPEALFGISLLASLALWFPTLRALLAGGVSIDTALIRYAMALVVALIAVQVIAAVVRHYRSANQRSALMKRREEQQRPRRRRSDLPVEEAGEDKADDWLLDPDANASDEGTPAGMAPGADAVPG